MTETQSSSFMQQIGVLNMRVGDMLSQLNAVLKAIMDENASLKKENADLKSKLEKTTKT